MGVDQFLLTWNNHRSNFPEVFSQLRFQDQLVDVTLLCDGGSYPAHRLVLAACSPYFHNLFTHLPTQHPLVYLKDVRQAELEALLEFIYRGEVSVANSELTGLIKIAESLRIKGLGDVSQRDPAPNCNSSQYSQKRAGSPAARVSKAARYYPQTECKPEMDLSSLLSAAQQGFRAQNSLSLESQNPFGKIPDIIASEQGNDNHDSSKLRSCLEGQEMHSNAGYPTLLAPPASSRLLTDFLKKETDTTPKKKSRKEKPIVENTQEQDIAEPVDPYSEIKAEPPNTFDDNSNHTVSPEEFLPNLRKIYESAELGTNSLFTKYTQLLSTIQQQAQPLDDDANLGYASMVPGVMTDAQVSPSQKDTKSLTCNLCGATIKHIANFRRHMKQHLNPRRFPCPWCSAAFGRKDNLKTHTRKHHPVEVEAEENASVLHNTDGTASNDEATTAFNGLETGQDSPNSSDTAKNDVEDGLVIAEDDEVDDEEIDDIQSPLSEPIKD